jgi:predicted nucleic acid-binding Zn ribbon protein
LPLEADHRHCKICGKVCSPSAETCSATCAEEREHRARTRRTYTLLLYGSIALLLLVFLTRVFT